MLQLPHHLVHGMVAPELVAEFVIGVHVRLGHSPCGIESGADPLHFARPQLIPEHEVRQMFLH